MGKNIETKTGENSKNKMLKFREKNRKQFEKKNRKISLRHLGLNRRVSEIIKFKTGEHPHPKNNILKFRKKKS